MDGYFWAAFASFFAMVSALTLLVALKDLLGYIKVLQSMITEARKLGFRVPEDVD